MRSKLGEMTNFDWEIPINDDGNLVLYAHVTMLLIKDNPILRGVRTIGLKFYCLHAVTISGTRKRL